MSNFILLQKGKIESINISPQKGESKIPIGEIDIDNLGLVGDAHRGNWHRQVSFMSLEDIKEFEKKSGQNFDLGIFAENLTLSNLDLSRVKIFDRIKINEVELEITQIGKTCHGGECAVKRKVGVCIVPQKGIFSRILKTGKIRKGDEVIHYQKKWNAKIIVMSDRAFHGEYEDISGEEIKKKLSSYFENQKKHSIIEKIVLPDEKNSLSEHLQKMIQDEVDFIVITGGTGIGPRDISPEVLAPLLEKELVGLMDYIRYKYGQNNKNALLSRSLAGVSGQSHLFLIPGSVKAVNEYMNEILEILDHSVSMLKGLSH